ncbi:MAG: hypothetical protein EON52_14975, partial [Actinomycetales bacterium]
MRSLDARFCSAPFHRDEIVSAGYSEKVLRGRRFRRVFPRVWVHVDHPMSEADWIQAGRLALPPDARLTGATRLRQLGVEVASDRLQFVVGHDLHLDLDGIDLHRTDSLPPCDDEGVSPAAAFIELRELVRAEAWREGAAQAGWVSRYLDPRSLSLQES